jgi:DNA-binding NarL/FixJ family response regulator
VALLDHRMPVADGLSVVEELARHSAVLVLTSSSESALIGPMLRRGARGYLVYGQFDPADLPRAVRAVSRGQGWLTPAAASVAAAAMRTAYAEEQAVERQQAGRTTAGLTDRETQILDLVGAGLGNADIAGRLGLSEKTVKNHLTNVFAKLGVRSRTEALIWWQGWR